MIQVIFSFLASLLDHKYKVIIYTGNVPYAGTDANVYITLYGSSGQSEEILLHDPTENLGMFETGQ